MFVGNPAGSSVAPRWGSLFIHRSNGHGEGALSSALAGERGTLLDLDHVLLYLLPVVCRRLQIGGSGLAVREGARAP